jgi:mannitol-1-/sugar-/sorbitol-6-/2-deoxyglucose-6-phosphatase
LIKAVIFDMDGVLIDSEPFWKIAEISSFNSVGVPLTGEMCETTVGMRIQEVTRYWFSKYTWDLKEKSFNELEDEIINGVISLIKSEGIPSEGVSEILDYITSKRLPMAIASSSSLKIINAVVDKFEIRKFFEVIHSAEIEKFGKPHPAIYLNTAKSLGIEPVFCLAIEDSFNGLQSAKDARMKTVVIPNPNFYDDPKFDIADLKLKSLLEFNEEHLKIISN